MRAVVWCSLLFIFTIKNTPAGQEGALHRSCCENVSGKAQFRETSSTREMASLEALLAVSEELTSKQYVEYLCKLNI